MEGMRNSKVSKILLSIVAVILVLGLIAEFGLRWFIGNQIAEDLSSSTTGEKAKVSFGASPLIFSLPQQRIPSLTVDSPSTVTITSNGSGQPPTIDGQPELHLVLKDFALTETNPTAGSLEMTTLLSDEYLLASIQSNMTPQQATGDSIEELASQFLTQLITVTAIKSNPSDGTMDVELTQGAMSLKLRPEVTNGGLGFTATEAAAFGMSLPEEIANAITDAFSQNVQSFGDGLSLESVEVADGGLRLHITGTNVPLSQL